MIVIRGGEVLTIDGWKTTDISIDGTVVSAVGPGPTGGTEIDATGCLVGPGFVDMHTHLREPGQTWKEDIASGSAAAVVGGFTAVTAMPNTIPPMDTPKVIESVVTAAKEVGLVDLVPSAALTTGRAGTSATDVEELYRVGVRLFTDDGVSVADADLLEDLMRAVADLPGAFVGQHAEDPARTTGGHMHEGMVSRRLGVGGLPAAAESDVVRRDLELAARTGARYHCQHVSAKMTVALLRDAKESGIHATAEVTPHHLTFDDSYLADLDPDFKMYPPLRSPDDREALVDALRNGTIDVVATDHAPHLRNEKQVDFADAPRGVIGLETAASAVWEALADRDRLFEALSMTPAHLLGLEDQGRPIAPGVTANLVVFNPYSTWTAEEFKSKSSNSPYKKREMKGQVGATVHRGQVVHQNRSVDG